jgi:ParB family chromosome partitioning protein
VRQHFDEESITALAQSIEEDGLLQNIAFTESAGKLLIVAGERRYRALKLLKDQGKDIPVMGKYVQGPLKKLAFVENFFREDLTVVEFSESLLELQKEQELNQGALGSLIGLKRTTVNGYIAIANMDESIKQKVRNNPDVPSERLVKIARIKGDDRKHNAVDKLLAELAVKNTDSGPKKNSPPKSSRGQIVADKLARYTENLGKVVKETEILQFTLEDRTLIASRLKEMQQKIQETLDGMAQPKENKDNFVPSANVVVGRADKPPFIRSRRK